MPIRADQLLVHRGLASSRTLAARLIAAGRVRCGVSPVRKPSEPLAEDADLRLAPGEEDRYVSRGGLKLAAAVREAGIDVRGWTCLDVGQSTGGFTDCLLQAGAAAVVGIDVGHGQLHPRLRADPRVRCLEGVNARLIPGTHGAGDSSEAYLAGQRFDLIVIDVSFISLTRVLPSLGTLAAPRARLVALVKPQFEVGPGGLDKQGVVRDAGHYPRIRETITACAHASGWQVHAWLDSPILGGEGNREFFLIATHAGAPSHHDSVRSPDAPARAPDPSSPS